VPDTRRRARAEALLIDLLEPVEMATIEVRMPQEERAKEVALALAGNPSEKRTLDEWGREVIASGRTLARSFLADAGIPFGRWRTLLRSRRRCRFSPPVSRWARLLVRSATTARALCRRLRPRDRHDAFRLRQKTGLSKDAVAVDESSRRLKGDVQTHPSVSRT